MAYSLKKGEFKTWHELLDLAHRALACSNCDDLVVWGRVKRDGNRCERCGSTWANLFGISPNVQRDLCLDCLYDVAAERGRLGDYRSSFGKGQCAHAVEKFKKE